MSRQGAAGPSADPGWIVGYPQNPVGGDNVSNVSMHTKCGQIKPRRRAGTYQPRGAAALAGLAR